MFKENSKIGRNFKGSGKLSGGEETFKKTIEVDHDGNESHGYINALTVYKGELYAGGVFGSAGGKNLRNIARWNGNDWLPVLSGINGSVATMMVYNDELYVGGIFDTAGGVSAKNIARWNGRNWSSIGTGIDSGLFASPFVVT